MSARKIGFLRTVLFAFILVPMAAAGWYTGMPHHPRPAGTATARLDASGPVRHGGIAVETLHDAQARLDSAPVENTHGDPVGIVANVVTNKAGRPQFVTVAFGGFFGIGKSVVPLKADTLGYDPRDNKVLTDMTRKELEVIAARRSREWHSRGS